MSTYKWLTEYDWVHTPEEVNELIESEDVPSLTSAEQIICVCWDRHHNAYLVVWRVRKWMEGIEP
jgi:hypothetical protein